MPEIRVSRPELRSMILQKTPALFKEHIKKQIDIFFKEHDNKKLSVNSWYVSSLSYKNFSVKIRGSGAGAFLFSVKMW